MTIERAAQQKPLLRDRKKRRTRGWLARTSKWI